MSYEIYPPAGIKQPATAAAMTSAETKAVQTAPTTFQNNLLSGWMDFKSPTYVKGLLLGAGAAILLGHPAVRKTVISGAVTAWDTLSGSVEELKEQVRDIKAEKDQSVN